MCPPWGGGEELEVWGKRGAVWKQALKMELGLWWGMERGHNWVKERERLELGRRKMPGLTESSC